MKTNTPAGRNNNATGSDYANIRQPLDIANALQGSPIRLLLDAGVSEFTIQTLAQTFGVKYLEQNYQKMIMRRNESKKLVDTISAYDDSQSSPFEKIIVTEGFMQEPYNKQLREHNVDKLPYVNKTNGIILVDLFSQGIEDLLCITLDAQPRNADIRQTYGINQYLFNPTQLLYVDLHNNDCQEDCTREGDEKIIPQYYVKSDALLFISLLPDNSVSYIISGFDDYVIKSYITLGAKYLESLNQELLRTAKTGGVILGVNYECKGDLKKIGFSSLTDNTNRSADFYCYQKS